MPDSYGLEKLLSTLPESIAAHVRAAIPSMRMTIARACVEQLRTKLRIDSVATGTCEVANIVGEEIKIGMKAESVALEESQVTLHANVSLAIQLPSIRKTRVYILGPVTESVSTPKLPRINVTSVAKELSATFTLSSIVADKITADLAPVRNVSMGAVAMESVEIEDMEIPGQYFPTGGAFIGDTTVSEAGVSHANAARGHVARASVGPTIHASDVHVYGATIANARASASGDDLDFGFEVQLPTLTIKTFPSMPAAIDRLFTRVSVRIEPKVVIQVGKLKLDGMTLCTRVGSVRMGSVSVPVEAVGLRMDDIAATAMQVQGVEMRSQGGESR